MSPNCKHEDLIDSPFFCYKCAAVRDSADEPWRELTGTERKRNVFLSSVFTAVLADSDLFAGHDVMSISGQDGNYNYKVGIMREKKNEVSS